MSSDGTNDNGNDCSGWTVNFNGARVRLGNIYIVFFQLFFKKYINFLLFLKATRAQQMANGFDQVVADAVKQHVSIALAIIPQLLLQHRFLPQVHCLFLLYFIQN